MNRIVRQHYPVEKLPEDLREGFPGNAAVTITIESEGAASRSAHPAETARSKPLSFLEARALAQSGVPIGDDAVERIRTLRDEWDT